jgi:hypothetical protein
MLIIASTTVRGPRTRGYPESASQQQCQGFALNLQRENLLDAGTIMKVVLGDSTEYRKCLPLPPQTHLTTSYTAGVWETMMSFAGGKTQKIRR